MHHSTSWHTEITVLEITGNNQGMHCSIPFIFYENKRNLIYSSAAFRLYALKTEEACLMNHLNVLTTLILARVNA